MKKKDFDDIAVEQGWDKDTQLYLIRRFIDEIDLYWLLSDFAKQIAENENEQ